MQIPILSGVYSDGSSDFRTRYPRNLIPVPKPQGISEGYLRPADGIRAFASGPGLDRGGINWQGTLYRVMGSSLVAITEDGAVTTIGDVGAGGTVSLDYDFDRLGIASGGKLFYWDGTSLAPVTDTDIGAVRDALWIAGYWMTTDGEFLVVTELNDPFTVNPLKYGSSESDPDEIVGIDKLRNEVYAFNRYSIEVFENVGGEGFPFARIEGAQVPRGVLGTHTYAPFAETFAFLGSGRNEAPAIYLMGSGVATRISTREIDQILAQYSEYVLSISVLESRTDKGHSHLWVRLPNETLVYDLAASQVVGEPVWFALTSSVVGDAAYRAINLVYCYNKWTVGDTQSSAVGYLTSEVSSQYGQQVGWEFGTMATYNESRGAIVHEVELVALSGRVTLSADPVIWTSYSVDGVTWSQERPISAGKIGDRAKRLCWRKQGHMKSWRVQKFRGTSDSHLAFARLEMTIEPLNA